MHRMEWVGNVQGTCIRMMDLSIYDISLSDGDILLEWFIVTNPLRAVGAGIFRRTKNLRDIEGQRRNQIIITTRQL